MSFNASIKYKIVPFFLSSLSLFLLLYFYTFFSYQNHNSKEIVQKVQTQIIFNDNKTTNFLNQLIRDYSQYSDSIQIFNDKYIKLNNSFGYSFFILTSSDSLLYWSDNSVPLDFINDFREKQLFNSGNGWYRLNFKEINNLTFISIYLIKHEYLYQNDYLRNNFNPSFNLSFDPQITTRQNGNDVFTSQNQYLFSLDFTSEYSFSDRTLIILFIIFLIALVLLTIGLYELHLKIFKRLKNKVLFIIGFIFTIIILRSILLFFKFPSFLHSGYLFSPELYAYSDIIPSLGDFLLHSVFLLIISVFLFKHVKFNFNFLKRKFSYKLFLQLSLFLHAFIFYKIVIFTFESLVLDSKISLSLNDVFNLTFVSFISFLIILFIIVSYFLIISRLCFFAFKYSRHISQYASLSIFTFFILLIYSTIFKSYTIDNLIIITILILCFGLIFTYHKTSFSLITIFIYIILFSFLTSYYLQKYNTIKENNNRIYVATQLSTEQHDPFVEFQFSEFRQRIIVDELFTNLINTLNDSNNPEKEIEDYISKKYFYGFWKKFDFQFTMCNKKDSLFLKPYDIHFNCFSFFENLKNNNGLSTKSKDFFLINYDNGDNGYLGILDFSDSLYNYHSKIFIEIIPRYFSNYLGFPELLVDKEFDKNIEIGEYSYAKYHDGELHKRVGRYYYNYFLNHSVKSFEKFNYYDEGGYNHLIYKSGNNNYLVISQKNKTFFDFFAPFSYIFLFYTLILSFYYFLIYNSYSRKEIFFKLRSKLQLTMVIIILFSFLSIGAFSISYIIKLNTQKNKDILSEKTHSVLVELEHKLSDKHVIDYSLSYYINDLLVKFSDVFFSDIILYDANGNMIGSSRQQIFNQKLISEKMNPIAFLELSKKNNSFFIHSENIGDQEYLSAYIPFFNNQSKKIAFLNLPYFAKENDLKREISNFLVAYINIYLILVVITIIIGFIVSNYISRPLKIIMNKISSLKLGASNEKINWYRDDEIGKLVSEYNRMIDEISLSAELLARSERESAWREMAKQVAHEIKNPLTPMKLSVQHIQRAWNEKVPDIDIRIAKFTNTMIDQIETLSAIASEFSDFAKMPATKNELFEISDSIQNSIILFKNYDNINIIFQNINNNKMLVYNDKEQLLRVFNNLLKNSIQAIGESSKGIINISLSGKTDYCEIEIKDNGAGIPVELRDKIFSPNFTTKSGGMGLGLAIAKSIVENSGGNIQFTSIENKGTTFTIKLPLAK